MSTLTKKLQKLRNSLFGKKTNKKHHLLKKKKNNSKKKHHNLKNKKKTKKNKIKTKQKGGAGYSLNLNNKMGGRPEVMRTTTDCQSN